VIAAVVGSRAGRRKAGTILLAAALAVGAATPALAQSGTMQSIQYGEVVSAEQTVVVQQTTGTGAGAGSTVGAIAGYALADRGDRWLGSLLGGVVGGAVGHAAEKKAKKKKGWTLIIVLEDGREVGVDVPSRKDRFEEGDRVRLMTGGGKTKVTKVKK
jgi:outer membrane lipoprotein SlyB